MSNISYSIKEAPVHYHSQQQGRCACGYAGMGAYISGAKEEVTCKMCIRVMNKKGETKRVRKNEKKK
jgi:hypothetical protein